MSNPPFNEMKPVKPYQVTPTMSQHEALQRRVEELELRSQRMEAWLSMLSENQNDMVRALSGMPRRYDSTGNVESPEGTLQDRFEQIDVEGQAHETPAEPAIVTQINSIQADHTPAPVRARYVVGEEGWKEA